MHNKCIATEFKASKYDMTCLNIRYDINQGHFPNSVQIQKKKKERKASCTVSKINVYYS